MSPLDDADVGSNDLGVPITTDALIQGLRLAYAFPHAIDGGVEIHETHISVVVLAGEFAYKIKKSVKTDFLDYSTLDLRRRYCEKEVQLDSRFACDLYIGVVPIGWDDGRLRIESETDPVEYAVKMRRFPSGALLSERIQAGLVTIADIHQLAESVARFHRLATICNPEFAAGWPGYLFKNFKQVFAEIQTHVDGETASTLRVLHLWIEEYFKTHWQSLELRVACGFVRECHGDLHLQNVVHWDEQFVPFDGIEFSERLRWIDVLCDAAFLQMDLAYHEHLDFARSFMNTYLERTGDYGSLDVLRLFLVYRALVRALVATIRSSQEQCTAGERASAMSDARRHIELAYRFTLKEEPQLWITHGLSGSGKTTLSEQLIQRHDVIRLRSDIERKRMFGLSPTERPSSELKAEIYSHAVNEKTYSQLQNLARGILRAGYGVVVDAAFLKHSDRKRFHLLAVELGVPFAILDCHGDEQTLRQRISDRMRNNGDASDADLRVLENQFATHEPLTKSELELIVRVP